MWVSVLHHEKSTSKSVCLVANLMNNIIVSVINQYEVDCHIQVFDVSCQFHEM